MKHNRNYEGYRVPRVFKKLRRKKYKNQLKKLFQKYLNNPDDVSYQDYPKSTHSFWARIN